MTTDIKNVKIVNYFSVTYKMHKPSDFRLNNTLVFCQTSIRNSTGKQCQSSSIGMCDNDLTLPRLI